MARYVDQILQPGERVLYSTTLSGIVYLPAILAWIVAVVMFVLSRKQEASDGAVMLFLVLAAVAALVAFYATLRAWFRRFTTETDVTTLRVVHKNGFIQRRTFEMNLDKVESVDVGQSIAGRLLNYGDVTIRGVGEGVETIRMIAAPLQFRNSITAR